MRRLLPVFLLGLATVLPAMQLQDVELVSPVTGLKCPVTVLMPNQKSPEVNRSDLGTDDDGCRHSANLSEYDLTIVTDPTSYFTALADEWDPATGKFLSGMPEDLKDWVIKELESEWKVDVARAFANAQNLAKNQGSLPPDRATFQIPQMAIPVEKRYRLALKCYDRRGARAGIMAKIALSGAWAIRARVNVPLQNQQLDGGYEEVREQVERLVPPSTEGFSLAVWLPAYQKVFSDGNLTREGLVVAGLTTFGFLMRDGDFAGSLKVLDTLQERLANDPERKYEILRGLVRERRRMLEEQSWVLDQAGGFLIQAIANEEFNRQKLPPHLLAVAECLRRSGDVKNTAKSQANRLRAMDWYYALTRLPEGQPALRDAIRAQGKAPGVEAPFHVQLAWLADRQYARLASEGVVHPGELSGVDKRLLSAVVFDGLGTADYVTPGWVPRKDGTQADSERTLRLLGQSAMDFAFRKGSWPRSLGELWETGILPDRNRINRFHDPATGGKIAYRPIPGEISAAQPRLVVVTTTLPVATPTGPRHGAYLAGNQVVWGEQPYTPGELAR